MDGYLLCRSAFSRMTHWANDGWTRAACGRKASRGGWFPLPDQSDAPTCPDCAAKGR